MTELVHAKFGQEIDRTMVSGRWEIRKQAVRGDGDDRYDARVQGIQREAWLLDHLDGNIIAPQLYHVGDDGSVQEDLGASELATTDGETFRRAMVRLLHQVRAANLRHGDLTIGNVVLRDGVARLCDWQDWNFRDDPPLQKHNRSDSYYLWRLVAGEMAAESVPDVPRVARRWQAVLTDLGLMTDDPGAKDLRFLDLGCFEGDFVAAAAAEGMDAVGIDQGGFRSGHDSIAAGQGIWRGMGTTLLYGDITDPDESLAWAERSDVVMLFSTWPYLLQDCQLGGPGPWTRERGTTFLRELAVRCGVLYFETQLAGDGPGPPWLKTDADTSAMLSSVGLKHEPLVTIHVYGRPASRTVWAVRA